MKILLRCCPAGGRTAPCVIRCSDWVSRFRRCGWVEVDQSAVCHHERRVADGGDDRW